jgi:hypothetical protein
MRWVDGAPLFVLTSDLDWASEDCIAFLFKELSKLPTAIVPTVHVTHGSAALKRLSAKQRVQLGIHPNFLPNSTHGASIEDVFSHVLSLAPASKAWRSHCFFDNTYVRREAVRRGIRYSSNTFAWLQPGVAPLRHWTGLMEFPLFWEDDVHWERNEPWELKRFEDIFLLPGLKVLNIHPFFFALNIPNAAVYARYKPFITTLNEGQRRDFEFHGRGCRTFTIELIETILAKGLEFVSFVDAEREDSIA